MDWRTWIYQQLIEEFVGEEYEENVFSAGSLTESPALKPFIVVTIGTALPQIGDATFTDMTLWVHDEPGDYTRIDEIHKRARTKLAGQVSEPLAMACNWLGYSPDFADDIYKTITRNASYRLVGRDNNVVD